jgi:predicted nucleotidyltransferase
MRMSSPRSAASAIVTSVSNERDHIVREVSRVLAAGPPLRLALLFGSAAKDRLRPDSDVDVGIFPLEDLSLAEELELEARLTKALGREVDLVRLDTAPALVRWQVAKAHLPISAHPEYELPRFLAQAAIDHAEMSPLYDAAQRALSRRLAGKR